MGLALRVENTLLWHDPFYPVAGQSPRTIRYSMQFVEVARVNAVA